MATQVPAKKGAAFTFEISLVSQSDTDIFKTTVTLAAGDIQVSKDGGQFANLATFPPAEILTAASGNSGVLSVVLTAAEMTADRVAVRFCDQAGAEWQDALVEIFTSTRQVDDLAFPTTSGRSLDVTATGAAGIDWANVEGPTTTLNLSGTTVKAVTDGVTAGTVSDKTGYSLAATGLDSITVTRPAAKATTFPQMIVQMFYRFFGKATMTSTQLKTYAADGTTVVTTQTLSDDSTTQTQGEAS